MNERLKKLRKQMNMTQEEFSKRIGIKRNTLANYEIGRNEPIDAVIFSICREFNVNEAWLRTGDGEMFITMTRDEELAKWAGKLVSSGVEGEFMKKFVHILSKLDSRDWETLEKVVVSMAEENKKEQEDKNKN